MTGAVENVGAGHIPTAGGGDGFFDTVLHLVDGGMFAVAVEQLEHERSALGDLGDLDEGVAVEAEAGQDVVAIGIIRAFGGDLVEGEGDGAGDLVEIEAGAGAVAFYDHARILRNGAVE